jgi:ribosomal protein S15P/S13E
MIIIILRIKSYNKTIERKLLFLTEKIKEVEEHFQVIQNDKLKDTVLSIQKQFYN